MEQRRKKPLEIVHYDCNRLVEADELLQRLAATSTKQANNFVQEQGRTVQKRAANGRINLILAWALILVLALAILIS